jgi:hypothetical protein
VGPQASPWSNAAGASAEPEARTRGDESGEADTGDAAASDSAQVAAITTAATAERTLLVGTILFLQGSWSQMSAVDL